MEVGRPLLSQAILLIGVERTVLSKETTKALGVKVRTLKSRVNRTRNRLAELMGQLRVKRRSSQTACRMISGGNWRRAEMCCIPYPTADQCEASPVLMTRPV
jgi:ABC-type lipopolysaccharide export system ATPase subunit